MMEIKVVKRKPQKQRTENINQEDSDRKKSNNFITDLHKFESDKDEELKKIRSRLQQIDDEIEHINNETRKYQQMKKCTRVNCALQHSSNKLEQLSHEKHTETLNLLYFPYAIEPQRKHIQLKKKKRRNNVHTAHFVNLRTFRRYENLDTLKDKGDNNIKVSTSHDSVTSSASASVAVNSTKAITLDKMVQYNHMFAKVSKEKKSDADDDASFESFDFNIEDFGVQLKDFIDKPLADTIIHKVDHCIDAIDMLPQLKFNTKDLLRKDLKSKDYFRSLCKLSDHYKRFYVLMETLKHKIQVLNKISETKLKLSREVQSELFESSKNLVEKIHKMEKLYRKLFRVCGMKEIEAMMVLPHQLRPYERCYRFIETSELQKFINLLSSQTQLMKDWLREESTNM